MEKTEFQENLKEERKLRIKENSEKVSVITRNLFLAGVGIVWMFVKPTVGGEIENSSPLIEALFCCVCAILLDLSQYLLIVIINAIFLLVKENMPSCAYTLPWLFWGVKIILTVYAYILIGKFLLLY
jgi:hypothetical protein